MTCLSYRKRNAAAFDRASQFGPSAQSNAVGLVSPAASFPEVGNEGWNTESSVKYESSGNPICRLQNFHFNAHHAVDI